MSTLHKIGTTVLDLTDADKQSAGEVVDTVERFWRDFPKAASSLATVSLKPSSYLDSPFATAQTGRLDQPIVPIHPGDLYKIDLNADCYGAGNRLHFLHTLREDEAAGFHLSHTPESIMEHELGHVLDLYEGQTLGGRFDPPSFDRIQLEDAYAVSQYGLLGGPHETFADAFAGWWSVRHPLPCRVEQAILSAARAGGWQEQEVAA